MDKTMKVLGLINIILSFFLLLIYIQFIVTSTGSSNDGWADLGFFLIMFVFLAIAVILTIPFLVIGFKRKFKDMKFYLITHIVYVGVAVSLFALSLA